MLVAKEKRKEHLHSWNFTSRSSVIWSSLVHLNACLCAWKEMSISWLFVSSCTRDKHMADPESSHFSTRRDRQIRLTHSANKSFPSRLSLFFITSRKSRWTQVCVQNDFLTSANEWAYAYVYIRWLSLVQIFSLFLDRSPFLPYVLN